MNKQYGFGVKNGFGFGVKGGFGFTSIVTAQILYSSPFTYTLDATNNTLATNKGSFDDAEVFSGGGLELGATNELPVPIPNNGGSNSFLTLVNGDGTVEQIGNSVDGGSKELVANGDFSDGTVDGWGDLYNSTIENSEETMLQTLTSNYGRTQYPVSFVAGKSYRVRAQHIGGTNNGPVVQVYDSAGIILNLNGVNVSNLNEIAVPNITGDGYIRLGTGNGPANGNTLIWDNVYIEEILPTSTTYDLINQTVLEAMPTTKELTTADLDLIRADTSLMTRLALGATDTGLSLITADVYGHYAFMEKNGAYCVETTAGYNDIVSNGNFNNGTVDWFANYTGSTIANVDGQLHVTAPSYGSCATNIPALTIGDTYLVTIDITDATGFPSFMMQVDSSGGAGATDVQQIYITNPGTVNTYSIEFIAQYASTFLAIWSNSGNASDWKIDNVSLINITTAEEISNYTSTIRTNVDFNPKGNQGVEFERDGAGVPTAYNNTQMNWHGDGYSDTLWNPSLETAFWIEEVIDNVVYQHKYDGTNLTTYTDNVEGAPSVHTPENATYLQGKGVYPKIASDGYDEYIQKYFSIIVSSYDNYDQTARYTVLSAI